MKNSSIAIFHTTICVGAPQITLMYRAKTATLLFARTSVATLRNGRLNEKGKYSSDHCILPVALWMHGSDIDPAGKRVFGGREPGVARKAKAYGKEIEEGNIPEAV